MITLRKTCGAAPELYDIITSDGELVGEIRTRWGHTTVTCPTDLEGLMIYETSGHEGMNSIPEHERDRVLCFCVKAVLDWIAAGRPTEPPRLPTPDVDYVIEDQEKETRLGKTALPSS